MNQVQFTVYGPPGAKGRPRFTKSGFVHTPKKTVAYENLVKVEYGFQTDHYRFEDDALLDMRVIAFYPIPKSAAKWQREMMLDGEVRPGKKPDLDNVLKVIADSLNEIAYHDDSQIVDCQIRKFYSEDPRVEVKIIQTAKKMPKRKTQRKKSGGAKS